MEGRILNSVLLSAGGTGGHIFPAIAVANEIKSRFPECEILFVGAEGKMEMEKVPQAGYKIVGLPIAGLQRKLTLSNFLLPIKIFIFTRWMKKNNKRVGNDTSREKETKILTLIFWSLCLVIMGILISFLVNGLGTNGVNIATAVIQVGTFMVKFFMMAFVYMWVRWTVLRIRYDQLQMLGWKVLIPLALLNIVITAIVVVLGN